MSASMVEFNGRSSEKLSVGLAEHLPTPLAADSPSTTLEWLYMPVKVGSCLCRPYLSQAQRFQELSHDFLGRTPRPTEQLATNGFRSTIGKCSLRGATELHFLESFSIPGRSSQLLKICRPCTSTKIDAPLSSGSDSLDSVSDHLLLS